MTTGRERVAVLVLGAVGAALALLAASQHWLTIALHDPLAGTGRLHPSGRTVATLVPAAALVALAASVAAVTLRRVGRHVSGLLLVAAGGAIAAASVSVLRDPQAAAVDVLRQATGRTGEVSATVTTGVWPWVAVVAGVPLVLGGAVTIARGRRWSGLSSRYDAPSAALPGGGAVGAGTTGAGRDTAADVAPRDPAVEAGDEAADAWDAVSRGEDPTR